MIQLFYEYDVVKVVGLVRTERPIEGTLGIRRQPQLGDVATIVHIPPFESEFPATIIVECSDEEGRTLWLADFAPEELELVNRPRPLKC